MEERFNNEGWDRGRNDPMEDSAPIVDESFLAELDAIERTYNQRNSNPYDDRTTSFLQRGIPSSDGSSPLRRSSSSSSSSSSYSSGLVPPLPTELWTDITERTPTSSLLAVSLISKENREIALRNVNQRRRKKFRDVISVMEWEAITASKLRKTNFPYNDEAYWIIMQQDPSFDQSLSNLTHRDANRLVDMDHFLEEGSMDPLMKEFRKYMESGGHPILTRLRMLYQYLSRIRYLVRGSGELFKAWNMDWENDRIVLFMSRRGARNKYILTIGLDNESLPSHRKSDGDARPVLRIRIPQSIHNGNASSDPSDPSYRPAFVSRYSPATALVTICSMMSGVLFSYVQIEYT